MVYTCSGQSGMERYGLCFLVLHWLVYLHTVMTCGYKQLGQILTLTLLALGTGFLNSVYLLLPRTVQSNCFAITIHSERYGSRQFKKKCHCERNSLWALCFAPSRHFEHFDNTLRNIFSLHFSSKFKVKMFSSRRGELLFC